MPVCCRHCGRELSSINVKRCPNPRCRKRLYKTKGDIVNCEVKKKEGGKSTIERAGKAAEDVLRSADWLLPKKRRG